MDNKYKLEVLDKTSLLELFGYELLGEFDFKNILSKDKLMDMGLKYAIIYNFDKVISEKIEDMEISLDNIMEARFFNEEKEIRIFRDEDKLKGTIFLENSSPYIENMSLLYPRYRENLYANKIDYKKYIDYDGDHQAYIRYIKPSKLYFKEENRWNQ